MSKKEQLKMAEDHGFNDEELYGEIDEKQLGLWETTEGDLHD